jgi:hypothetical protein
MLLPESSSWAAVEQWLRQGGAEEEVLLVFENTEDVLCHISCAQVRTLSLVPCCVECVSVRIVVLNVVLCHDAQPSSGHSSWITAGCVCYVWCCAIHRSFQCQCTVSMLQYGWNAV